MTADAELIRLGQEFDRLAIEYRPLRDESHSLFNVYEAAATAAGLPEHLTPEDKKQRMALMRSTGYHAAADAANACHSQLVAIMHTIHKQKATTLAGFAVKLMAIAFDQFDFDVDPEPSDVAERQLFRLVVDMRKAAGASG